MSGNSVATIQLASICVKIENNEKLVISESRIVYSDESDWTKTFTLSPEDGNITLPQNDRRPYIFVVRYDAGDENNDSSPGSKKYAWNETDPKLNIKIWEDIDGKSVPEPEGWGANFPPDFSEPSVHGNMVFFCDNNGADGNGFSYCIRLSVVGSSGEYSEPLDPRIVNSGRG